MVEVEKGEAEHGSPAGASRGAGHGKNEQPKKSGEVGVANPAQKTEIDGGGEEPETGD